MGSLSQKNVRAVAVAEVPQFAVQLLAPGRWSRQVLVMILFLQGNLAAVAAQPFKKRFGSNGTCLRHRW